MTFNEAMQSVLNGQTVTRFEWDDKNTYVYLGHINGTNDRFLCIHNSQLLAKPGRHVLQVRDADMLADDWYICPTSPTAIV